MRPWLLALLLLLLVGCAVDAGKVYVKDGQRYGVTTSRIWRARWWNYYERGLSYASGGFWEDAIADYQTAIKQRHDDRRGARTYGLHRIDYFPHCELGIVYYNIERFDEAERELQTSLAVVDRARCKFYLNKVRVALLRRDGTDKSPPRLVLNSPADGLVTNAFKVVVSGQAEDDTYVATVAINDEAQFIELAESRIPFRQEVTLQDGPNTIDIVAGDLLDQQTRQRVTVYLDRYGPLLSIENIAITGTGEHRQARLQGYLSDRSRIVRFAVAGQTVPLQEGEEGAFRYDAPLRVGVEALPFEAEDAVGNITQGSIALTTSTLTPTRRGDVVPPTLTRWASLSSELVLSDAGPAPFPRLTQSPPASAPVITLADLQDIETVYSENVYLEGTVTSTQPITQFSIAGESLWRRRSRQLFFGYIARLQEGENRLLLQAVDAQGNRTQREITITRKIRKSRDIASRLQVAMLPFSIQGTPTVLAQAVDTTLLNAIIRTERFSMLERQQLEAILSEIQLSQTELVDRRTAVRVGRLAKAEDMLVGSIIETPPSTTKLSSLTVFIRFVDAESSEVLLETDVYGEGLNLAALTTLMEGLASKIQRYFPLREGTILAKEGEKISVDFSTDRGIKTPMKLIVFRPGETVTRGRLTFIGPDTVLGEARITEVDDGHAEAVVLQPDTLNTMQDSDLVITK